MIKLVVFDLDGILVNTKEVHFEALNRALTDSNIEPISYKDHINKYDGHPTKEKMVLLNIPENKRPEIETRKKAYTTQLLEVSVKTDTDLISVFKALKQDGLLLHVASNSIRSTVEVVLKSLGVIQFVDYIISNEDVAYSKPHPEMYLRCMLHAGVGPRETIVVEDSYVGRQGAFNSGATLSSIKSRDEVTYIMLKKDIEKSENNKLVWKSNNLNVIIPMAGAGSRFQKAGYTFPKPLIDVHGKTMIQIVVENLNIDSHYIYLVRREHYEKYSLKPLLEMMTPECDVVIVDELTEGAACTLLLAKNLIDTNSPLLIANSDQYMEWDSSHFMYTTQNGNMDGYIPVFESSHPKWSYAKTDENDLISEIKEKQVVSNKATCGIYYWKKGSDFVKYAEQMIQRNIRVNNEFYVAPVYNEAINGGKKFKTYSIDKMYGLGTPEDLEFFLQHKGSK